MANWSNSQFKQSQGRRGNKESWTKAAKMLSGIGKQDECLEALGLSEYPETLNLLKSAYHKSMLKVHPDMGGTEEQAMKVNEAYENLKEKWAK